MTITPASGTSNSSCNSSLGHDGPTGFADQDLPNGTTSTGDIPIIDLSPWTRPEQHSDAERRSTVNAVERACRAIGFFALQGHHCSRPILERAWSEAAAFFDLPAHEKLQSQTPADVSEYPYGYEQSERLSLGKRHQSNLQVSDQDNNIDVEKEETIQQQQHPDLKETFRIGPSNPDSGMPARRWPAQPPNFAAALTEYYQEMEKLSAVLLQIFAVALQLPRDWFVPKMDHHMSALRVLNYFPVHLTLDVPEGAIRAGAHTDYGAFTILKSGGPGLQVKKDNQHASSDDDDDEWIDVPTLENVLVINLGDMMQRWTNDKWVSTLHRVILKADDDMKSATVINRRQSIAYFCNINHDTSVEPISTCIDGAHPSKYEAVTAGQYLLDKHYASMQSAPSSGATFSTKDIVE